MNNKELFEKEVKNIVEATISQKVSWNKYQFKDIYYIEKMSDVDKIKVFIEKQINIFPSHGMQDNDSYTISVVINDKTISSKRDYEFDDRKLLLSLFKAATKRHVEEKEMHDNAKMEEGLSILKKVLEL